MTRSFELKHSEGVALGLEAVERGDTDGPHNEPKLRRVAYPAIFGRGVNRHSAALDDSLAPVRQC